VPFSSLSDRDLSFAERWLASIDRRNGQRRLTPSAHYTSPRRRRQQCAGGATDYRYPPLKLRPCARPARSCIPRCDDGSSAFGSIEAPASPYCVCDGTPECEFGADHDVNGDAAAWDEPEVDWRKAIVDALDRGYVYFNVGSLTRGCPTDDQAAYYERLLREIAASRSLPVTDVGGYPPVFAVGFVPPSDSLS
jgi:hypothetical protein